jgi:hypothetical protein
LTRRQEVAAILEQAERAAARWELSVTPGFCSPPLAADALTALAQLADVEAFACGGYAQAEVCHAHARIRLRWCNDWCCRAQHTYMHVCAHMRTHETHIASECPATPTPLCPQRCRLVLGREDMVNAARNDVDALSGVVAALDVAGNFMFDAATHRDFLGALIGTGVTRERVGVRAAVSCTILMLQPPIAYPLLFSGHSAHARVLRHVVAQVHH